MPEAFKVEIPITVKGGREGRKVGKDIGEKIADQLKKVFKGAGIGRPAAVGGKGIGAESPTITGMGKSLKGILGTIGIIAAGVGVITAGLAKSSPYLKGILSLFGRAFTTFFRPFGDFLATLLRPLAIALMKMAVAFLKWTRTPVGAKALEEAIVTPRAVQLLTPIGLGAELGTLISYWFKGIDFSKLKEFPGWLWGKIIGIWEWTENLENWLWVQIQTIWNYGEDFGGWLWDQLITIWNYAKDFGRWLWDQLITVWNYAEDFGKWLWDEITSAFSNVYDWLSGFGSWLWDKITSALGRLVGFFTGGQVGIPNVPHEGLYHLHKGEEVVPRTRVGGNRSIMFSPTFQIYGGGITQDIDMDAIVRRTGRMTEMDLKQRGII